jgi:hypothetical protein
MRKQAKYEGKTGLRSSAARERTERSTGRGMYDLKWLKNLLILRRQKFTKLFTSYSHHCPSRPASGSRVETVTNYDKKKSEFYFLVRLKKILTENVMRCFPSGQKNAARAPLTALPASRIVFLSWV